jgi:Lipocalin-like domain
MQRRIAAALTGFAFLMLAWPARAEDITSSIVGLWKLTGNTTKIVATGAMQRVAGEHPIGYQLFTKGGHMMFIQNSENRKPPAGAVLTDAERAALFTTLVAYAGTYKVSGSKVSIHMEANAVPGAPDRTYAVEITGNKLTLTADNPFVNSNGQQIVSIRTFERAD